MRICVLDDHQSVATTYGDWSSIGDDVEVVSLTSHVSDVDELVSLLRDATVVVAMRERTALGASLFAQLPSLELLVTTGPSNAVIDVDAAVAHGVTVCGTLGLLTPTSELTWGLIHAVLRSIPADDAAMKAGGWQTRVGVGLAGKRLGVLGLGRLGTMVARVGLAFDMDVVAWSQNLTAERCASAGVGYVDRDELFSTADVLTIHLVLSDRTRRLVGPAELAMMKPSAVLINTSRGPIVDEAALVDALRSGTIAGAGLDVFDTEPLPTDSPLRSLGANVVLTPHMGYVTDECYRIFYDHIVEDIRAWRDGEPVRVIAAPAKG